MFNFDGATIKSIHAAFLAGTLTCEELARICLDRIESLDKSGPRINAVICVNPNAIEQAAALDAQFASRGLIGSLFGIPVLLKDNCETFDMPTTAGSMSLKGWRTGKDAQIVGRLRAAGALIIAKTNLHEFAVWGETVSSILGQTLNPYDLFRTPGGSSGGTGAGLAAGYGIVGIGTDTVNSIRSPASACCLVGIRPTIGLVSGDGIVPYSLTQDTAGPLARTVGDAAAVLSVITGNNYEAKAVLKGKHIGVIKSLFGGEPENQAVNSIISHGLEALKAGGAQLFDVEEIIDTDRIVGEVSVHLHDLKTHLGEYLRANNAPVKSLGEILESGNYTPDIEENLRNAERLGAGCEGYAERLQKRSELQDLLQNLLAKYKLDAFVYPHQRQLVCKVGGSQKQRNGALASVSGFPAITLPCGFAPAETAPVGVPVGIEFLGAPGGEQALIEIACEFESLRPARKPPVF